jgi:hypothetical protein
MSFKSKIRDFFNSYSPSSSQSQIGILSYMAIYQQLTVRYYSEMPESLTVNEKVP